MFIERVVTPETAPAVVRLKALLVKARVPEALPTVVAAPAPEAKVVVELEERVVKAPVEGVVAPIAVELIPVLVVLKLPEVKVRLLTPVLIEEAERPERERAPEIAVKFKAPVVRVSPFEAVRVEENRPVPVTSRVVPGAVFPIPTLPPKGLIKILPLVTLEVESRVKVPEAPVPP